jgi:hypothetical protein
MGVFHGCITVVTTNGWQALIFVSDKFAQWWHAHCMHKTCRAHELISGQLLHKHDLGSTTWQALL